MKFTELKQSLKNKILPAYLLSGEDLFLISNAKKSIITSCDLQMEELNLVEFSGDNLRMEDVVSSCETLPFLCEKKVVILNLFNKISSAEIGLLNAYLQNPSEQTCLVVVDSIGIELTKAIKNIENVDCNRLPYEVLCSWVQNSLKKMGKTISPNAMRDLCEFSNFYLVKIDNELNKLVSYIGDKTQIESEDVRTLVSKDFEYQIFELSDAIGKKDSVKAFKIINSLKENKDNSGVVVSTLYAYFRRMFFSVITKKDNFEIAKLLGVKEYAVTMAKRQATLFSPVKLKTALELCADAEFQFKSGKINKDFANEQLIIKLLAI